MIRRIFVPLDGTPFSELALPAAATLARVTGATIDLVHVHAPGPLESPIDCDPGADAAARGTTARRRREHVYGWLEHVASTLRLEACVSVYTHALCGNVSELLCEEVAGLGADLVIMATHARRGMARVRFGSVAESLVRHAAAPVLLVQAGREQHSTSMQMRQILAVYDDSGFARQILPHARALACAAGAGLSILRTTDPAEIQAYAERLDADVIAIATHGRGGLSRLLLGSTADGIVNHTTRPVLLIRPQAGSASVQRTAWRGIGRNELSGGASVRQRRSLG